MGRSRTQADRHPLWVKVCDPKDLEFDVGVCALVHGKQIALFMTGDRAFHAVANRDPFSGTQSMSRGIVGSRGGAVFVAAPIGRQIFDLATGQCKSDPNVVLHPYPVRIVDGYVEVCVSLRA